MWNFQALLGAAGVTLVGGRAPGGEGRPSRTVIGLPYVDPDWDWCEEARASGHLGPGCWGGGGHREAGGTRSSHARRLRSAQGRVEGRRRRPPHLITQRRGRRLSRVGRGASRAGGGRGVVVEGVRGAGVRELAAARPAQD